MPLERGVSVLILPRANSVTGLKFSLDCSVVLNPSARLRGATVALQPYGGRLRDWRATGLRHPLLHFGFALLRIQFRVAGFAAERGGRKIKPIERLVLVNFTHCYASSPRLSTADFSLLVKLVHGNVKRRRMAPISPAPLKIPPAHW